MASTSRSPCYTSKTPHFFKVVLAHTLSQGKLEVPKNFVRKHAKAFLKDQVRLKTPGGGDWTVCLRKSSGNVWFQNGLKEFMEFYSVNLNYFLVFRYEGNSCFHVIIFDPSASEIRYPLEIIQHDEDEDSDVQIFDNIGCKRENGEDYDFDVQILDNIGCKRENGEDYDSDVQILDNIGCKRENGEDYDFDVQILDNIRGKREREETDKVVLKKMRSDPSPVRNTALIKYNSIDFKIETMMEGKDLHCSNRRSKACKFEGGDSSTIIGWRKQSTLIASQQAIAFMSTMVNPAFMVIMQPTYISSNFMNMPTSFSGVHVKKSGDIIVRVSDGRVWSIRCIVRWGYKQRKVELRSGWLRFVKDNTLREGDICVFEKIQSFKMTLIVTIFRN